MAFVSVRLGAVGASAGASPAFLAATLAAPCLLAIGRALPDEDAGLALRLSSAAALVLVVPGWLVLCAIGRSDRSGLNVAVSVLLSLAVCFVALALTFAAGAALSLAVVLLGILIGGAFVAAVRGAPARLVRGDVRALLALGLLGVGLCGLAWWSATASTPEELIQLARVRKLDEVPTLFGVSVVGELRGGIPSPASAFPLWDGVLALIGRLAAVEPRLVVQHTGAVLVPLALVLAYAAGRELFGRVAGGIATAVGQLAVVALPIGGTGALASLALPSTVSRLLLVPALLAVSFAWLSERRWLWPAGSAAGALSLAAVRISHLALVALGLAGFGLVRLLGGVQRKADAPRLALVLAALVVVGGLFFLWLWPFAGEANAFLPSPSYRDAAVALHGERLVRVGGLFALEPSVVATGGAGVIAGLLATIAAVVAVRRRWGAFVVGSTLALLAAALVPAFFRPLSDLLTLPEAARLAVVLPLPYALAGAALVVARAGVAGVVAAVGLGIGLALAYGEGGATGPSWAAWVAIAACLVSLAASRWHGRPDGPGLPAVVAAVGLAIPLAVVGLSRLERERPDPKALPAGLVDVVRAEVPPRGVVFADLETGYRLAAEVPIVVVALPAGLGPATGTGDEEARRRDVVAFYRGEGLSYLDRADILTRYGSRWLVVDHSRPVPAYLRFLPAPSYEDGRYAFYDLER